MGRGHDVKKVYWVSWDSICLPKEEGGLGVKHRGLFNLALLSKWKWQILNDDSSL